MVPKHQVDMPLDSIRSPLDVSSRKWAKGPSSINILSLLLIQKSKVAKEVVLMRCTYKKILAKGKSGKDPSMLKSSSRQQKEERRVENIECVVHKRTLGVLRESLL